MFTKLTKEQLRQKTDYINSYVGAINAASGSEFDPNANVTSKNVATLQPDIFKDFNVQLKRYLISDRIEKMYGKEIAQEYNRQIEAHEIYVHDESHPIFPYCVSISMYPFLLNGLGGLGGDAKAPKHLDSFCGGFINLVYCLASQFAGAVATVEFLMVFNYYAIKDFGRDYLKTHKDYIKNKFEQVIYSLNQPAGARSYQCPFWNISIFDKYYFDGMFGEFCFPDDDMTKPDWETLNELQKYFMEWFNQERERALLTFPVVTAASLTENGKVKDKEFNDFLCNQMSKGNSFFNYMSDSVDSLSSCCRLQNKLQEKNTFSFSLGAGGVQAGSINVITLNFNRMTQNADREGKTLEEKLRWQLDLLYKYQNATYDYFKSLLQTHMLPAYDSGFINMKKQYLTIGINGMLEAAEYKGITPGNNPEYIKFLQDNLKIMYECNLNERKSGFLSKNVEFVPAENLGCKNYHWDKKDGYVVNPNRNCYNSYFYPVEADENDCNIVDKFVLHGKDVIQYLDGGSALHLNLADYPTKDGYKKLFELAAKTGCNYWTTNIAVTCCEDCGYIGKKTQHHCHKCKSRNVTWATRIIGYLRKITNFSEGRQLEESMRHYHKINASKLFENDIKASE